MARGKLRGRPVVGKLPAHLRLRLLFADRQTCSPVGDHLARQVMWWRRSQSGPGRSCDRSCRCNSTLQTSPGWCVRVMRLHQLSSSGNNIYRFISTAIFEKKKPQKTEFTRCTGQVERLWEVCGWNTDGRNKERLLEIKMTCSNVWCNDKWLNSWTLCNTNGEKHSQPFSSKSAWIWLLESSLHKTHPVSSSDNYTNKQTNKKPVKANCCFSSVHLFCLLALWDGQTYRQTHRQTEAWRLHIPLLRE